jgi:uncharacterized membrane protein YraQ (UPF0718 family)
VKRVVEWARHEALFVLAVLLYVWAFAVSPARALEALSMGWRTLLGVLPIIVAVFGAVGLFGVWVDRKKIAGLLGKGGGVKAVFVASMAGTILVGPAYVIFPLLKAVHEHGARWAVLGAVLAAWAVKIPMVPLEIGMLGLPFSLARVALVILAAVPVGFLLEWLMEVRSGDRAS